MFIWQLERAEQPKYTVRCSVAGSCAVIYADTYAHEKGVVWYRGCAKVGAVW